MQFSTAQSSRSLLHILFFFHTLSFFGLSARFVVISSSLTPPSTFSLSFSNSLPSFPHFLQLFLTWACRLFLPITHLPWLSPLFWCLIIGVLSPVLLSNEPKDRFGGPEFNDVLLNDYQHGYLLWEENKKWRGCLFDASTPIHPVNTVTGFFYLIYFDVFSECKERAVKLILLCVNGGKRQWLMLKLEREPKGRWRERKTDYKRHQQGWNSVWNVE